MQTCKRRECQECEEHSLWELYPAYLGVNNNPVWLENKEEGWEQKSRSEVEGGWESQRDWGRLVESLTSCQVPKRSHWRWGSLALTDFKRVTITLADVLKISHCSLWNRYNNAEERGHLQWQEEQWKQKLARCTSCSCTEPEFSSQHPHDRS